MSAHKEILGLNRITKKRLKELCKKDRLYQTPGLNDVLYLHYQGFQAIESLEDYVGLKCLWLESNAISEISGLENQSQLKCLFLQNNLVKRIENLDNCRELDTLNLSSNHIRKIENCGADILPVLTSLNLSSNYLCGSDCLRELVNCIKLTVLDLSNNRINDILCVKIFSKMPQLRVLVLQGNPVVSKIPQYRKTLILECKELTYLDSRPVFPRDRACAEAWKRGGYEEERQEHDRWNREERRKIRECVNATLRLRNKHAGGDNQVELIRSSDEEDAKDDRPKSGKKLGGGDVSQEPPNINDITRADDKEEGEDDKHNEDSSDTDGNSSIEVILGSSIESPDCSELKNIDKTEGEDEIQNENIEISEVERDEVSKVPEETLESGSSLPSDSLKQSCSETDETTTGVVTNAEPIGEFVADDGSKESEKWVRLAIGTVEFGSDEMQEHVKMEITEVVCEETNAVVDEKCIVDSTVEQDSPLQTNESEGFLIDTAEINENLSELRELENSVDNLLNQMHSIKNSQSDINDYRFDENNSVSDQEEEDNDIEIEKILEAEEKETIMDTCNSNEVTKNPEIIKSDLVYNNILDQKMDEATLPADDSDDEHSSMNSNNESFLDIIEPIPIYSQQSEINNQNISEITEVNSNQTEEVEDTDEDEEEDALEYKMSKTSIQSSDKESSNSETDMSDATNDSEYKENILKETISEMIENVFEKSSDESSNDVDENDVSNDPYCFQIDNVEYQSDDVCGNFQSPSLSELQKTVQEIKAIKTDELTDDNNSDEEEVEEENDSVKNDDDSLQPKKSVSDFLKTFNTFLKNLPEKGKNSNESKLFDTTDVEKSISTRTASNILKAINTQNIQEIVDRVYAQKDKYDDDLDVIDGRLMVVKKDTGAFEELPGYNSPVCSQRSTVTSDNSDNYETPLSDDDDDDDYDDNAIEQHDSDTRITTTTKTTTTTATKTAETTITVNYCNWHESRQNYTKRITTNDGLVQVGETRSLNFSSSSEDDANGNNNDGDDGDDDDDDDYEQYHSDREEMVDADADDNGNRSDGMNLRSFEPEIRKFHSEIDREFFRQLQNPLPNIDDIEKMEESQNYEKWEKDTNELVKKNPHLMRLKQGFYRSKITETNTIDKAEKPQEEQSDHDDVDDDDDNALSDDSLDNENEGGAGKRQKRDCVSLYKKVEYEEKQFQQTMQFLPSSLSASPSQVEIPLVPKKIDSILLNTLETIEECSMVDECDSEGIFTDEEDNEMM